MTNFVLVHLRLEDKTTKTIRTCHECGEQFRSQRVRKYCSKRCSMEQNRRNNINPFSKRTVTDKADRLERPIDPDSYGHGCVGVSDSHNPFAVYDLSDGMPNEDMFYINRQMALAYQDNERQRRKKRSS